MKGEAASTEAPALTVEHMKKLSLVVLYILTSSALIRFNKFMMHADRFPYSMCLTACHMSMSLLLCLLFYAIKPSAFPGLEDNKNNAGLLLKRLLPIGLAFAASLYTSNQAYFYCNVAFLQFMKEANVIICFLMSVAAGLQSVRRIQFAIILWILAGSSCAVQGEMSFVFYGFVLQLTSQFAECLRVVLGEVVLVGGGLKLDPLSYTALVSPACLVILLIGTVATWDPAIPGAMAKWWMYLLPNSMLAFALNLLVTTMIKELSAVGFVLGGLCKDVAIVLFSVIAFDEPVSAQQCSGFITTLMGVATWSYLKMFPGVLEQRLAEWGLGCIGGEPPPPKHDFVPVAGDDPADCQPAVVYGQARGDEESK